jgi:hypothetical protein
MSNRATLAYEAGLVPASKVRGVPAHLVEQFCRYEEWHHSSKFANQTNFYDPHRVRATFGLVPNEEADPAAVAALAAWKAERKAPPQVIEAATVRWLEWAGSIKHPTATERVAYTCRVELKGQTATVTLVTGRSFKKRLTTRGFSFEPQTKKEASQ